MRRRTSCSLADCEAVLVTQSEHGMTLVPRKGDAIHVPAHPVKVRDVSGAGDTVAAVLAVALAAGADWETALRMANAAAAVAVSKKGTAIVTSAELRRKILPHAYLAAEEKIMATSGELDAQLQDWRKQGLRVGFTNGCFDILHPGHVKLLTAARGACDRLIVGLNSDASVTRLKGEDRPVQNERARAEVLAALEAVDLVVLFEEDTPIKLITQIKPSVLVKGGDYTREQVVGHEIVEAPAAKCCWSRSCPVSARRRWSIARAGQRNDASLKSDLAQRIDRDARRAGDRAGVVRELLSALRGRRVFLRSRAAAAAHPALFHRLQRGGLLRLQSDHHEMAFHFVAGCVEYPARGHGADAGASGAGLHFRRAQRSRHASSSARSPSFCTGSSRCFS